MRLTLFCILAIFLGAAPFVVSAFLPPLVILCVIFSRYLTRVMSRKSPLKHVQIIIALFSAPYSVPFIGGLLGFFTNPADFSTNLLVTMLGALGMLLSYYGHIRALNSLQAP